MIRFSFRLILVSLLTALVVSGCSSGEGAPEAQGGAVPQEQNAQKAESAGHDAEHEDMEHGEEHAELAIYMSRMQRWTHKAALAVEAENGELSDFYLHELEETIETVQMEVPVYEGYEIGTLTETILVPEVEALDGYVDEDDWDGAQTQLAALSNACNQCHAATDHGFIRIQLEDLDRPFTQTFEKRE